jgi:exosome complex RNA-binding protein Rrp4
VGKDGSLVASVVGTVERVNKLVTVKGVGGVYNGEVGNNGDYIIYDEITLCERF